ncbi:uncharacterized protein UV8b_03536 [Ustilaginoidea virens]|uniref:Uncharacterized protein n=1 Tax=Ustilaginoidea virens TaxID=1159556 RepID=A0A8E5HPJ5_USTVR|nr:uncharacterized protein UV8b_03536 [Ustilaginoidea virens]QUC19295.1 hypothetical protein UV8b_03536 [Ustilaginoidea virens]
MPEFPVRQEESRARSPESGVQSPESRRGPVHFKSGTDLGDGSFYSDSAPASPVSPSSEQSRKTPALRWQQCGAETYLNRRHSQLRSGLLPTSAPAPASLPTTYTDIITSGVQKKRAYHIGRHDSMGLLPSISYQSFWLTVAYSHDNVIRTDNETAVYYF